MRQDGRAQTPDGRASVCLSRTLSAAREGRPLVWRPLQGAHHVPHPGGSRGQPGLGRWAKDSTADNLTADASLMETPNGLAVTPPPPATQAHGSLRAGLSGPVSHKLDTQSFGHLFTHQSMGTLPLCTHTLSCVPDHLSSSQALSELGPALASSHQLHPSCSGGPPPWLLPTWDQRESVAGGDPDHTARGAWPAGEASPAAPHYSHPPPHPRRNCFHETGPWCPNGWGPLRYTAR